jgi:hypothetical protein
MRFAEALRGERASPSLKRPTRDDDGARGMRSMPSLNRRGREAKGPSGVVWESWWEVMLPSAPIWVIHRVAVFGPLVGLPLIVAGAHGGGNASFCALMRERASIHVTLRMGTWACRFGH